MNKKKWRIGLSAIALAGILAVGGVLAWLTAQTATKKNTFVATAGLSGAIQEVNWDGLDYGNNPVTPQPSPLGRDMAKDMLPGMVIPKNPQVKNTSQKEPAYIAVRLDISCDGAEGQAALDAVSAFADIRFNTGEWTALGTSKDGKAVVYVYNTAVEAGSETSDVFKSVNVHDNANAADIKDFQIDAAGYLAQVQSGKTAADCIKAAFPDLV